MRGGAVCFFLLLEACGACGRSHDPVRDANDLDGGQLDAAVDAASVDAAHDAALDAAADAARLDGVPCYESYCTEDLPRCCPFGPEMTWECLRNVDPRCLEMPRSDEFQQSSCAEDPGACSDAHPYCCRADLDDVHLEGCADHALENWSCSLK